MVTPGSIGRSLLSRGLTPAEVVVSVLTTLFNDLAGLVIRLRRAGDADQDGGGGDADDDRADQAGADLLGDEPRPQGERTEHVAELPNLPQADSQLQGPGTEVDDPGEEPHDRHLAEYDHGQEREKPGERAEGVRGIDDRAQGNEEHHGEQVTER